MPSLRQKLLARRQNVIEQVAGSNSLSVESMTLTSRDQNTGLWAGSTANGASRTVKKLGISSGYGLELPALIVKNGVGRFAE